MKGRASNNVQSKRAPKNGRRDQKPQQANGAKRLAEKESKFSDAKQELNVSIAGDSTTQSEVSETMNVHNVGGGNGSADAHQDSDSSIVSEKVENDNSVNDSTCVGRENGKDGGLDSQIEKDSKTNTATNVPGERSFEDVKTGSVSLSEVSDSSIHGNRSVEEAKEFDVWEDASNGALSAGSENEAADVKENGRNDDAERLRLERKIEYLETRIEKLEEELREVAALEISLYSVVPDHSSSVHKVHTPARRLSRLYIHACKHWTQIKRASIARNTVSGLILVAKSCGNDVSRLTFWLSNTIALREIISQAFGSSRISSPFGKISELNGSSGGVSGKTPNLKRKKSIGPRQSNGFMQFFEDWQETGTFVVALEKVESWVFSRIIESVWWQVFTPCMQSPEDGSSAGKTNGELIGPSSSDQQQGDFSVNLWKKAFKEALQRLCPIRGGGHECGCLPVLARMVMEQCIARLDVAMFNAILRESEHQIPTDPVSDPILDSKVLPISAGDLSFGSGALLKNTVGNWSRWLTDMFGMDSDDSGKVEEQRSRDDCGQREDGICKPFLLLNDLSDLLMLPKDMLVDRSIREEVCPTISLPLIKRILCNFTPDEFCPDHVNGAILEALNAESNAERKLTGDSSRGFPYAASPVYYSPPSSDDVAEKVAEAGDMSQLLKTSMIQRKGYTSDEELEELDSPLTCIIDKTSMRNGNAKQAEHIGAVSANARYELLREVWST